MKAKKRNILLIAVLIIISSGALYFFFMSHKENVYQERYSELYYIEDYLQGIESRNDLCESIQYNNDGSETYFSRNNGVEESVANNVYTNLNVLLVKNQNEIMYYILYEKMEDSLMGRRNSKMIIKFFMTSPEGKRMRYVVIYNYGNLKYEEYISDENQKILATDFDEDGQKIYDLIIEDIMNRIEQCK